MGYSRLWVDQRSTVKAIIFKKTLRGHSSSQNPLDSVVHGLMCISCLCDLWKGNMASVFMFRKGKLIRDFSSASLQSFVYNKPPNHFFLGATVNINKLYILQEWSLKYMKVWVAFNPSKCPVPLPQKSAKQSRPNPVNHHMLVYKPAVLDIYTQTFKASLNYCRPTMSADSPQKIWQLSIDK